MDDAPPLDFYYPLWLVVDRAIWLERGLPWGMALVMTADVGKTIALLDDEHQALQFLDDAKRPEWATILMRDGRALLDTVRHLPAVGMTHVGFNIHHPNSPRGPGGWFIPVSHLIDRLSGRA